MIRTLWASGDNAALNEPFAAWCAQRIGFSRPLATPCLTLGVFDGQELIAVVAYNNWCPEAGVIEMHAASVSARWMTRAVLKEMFAYPFGGLGCQMVVLRVSERNTRLHRQLTAYGFDHVRVPRLRGKDEAELIFTLTDEAWRSNGFHR